MTRRVTVAGIAACLLCGGLIPPSAWADGDPASDVLLAANVFYPYSPPVSTSLQRALDSEAAAAKRAGFPIKVALIHSPVDLGSIPELFLKPQPYAEFLDQEISFSGPKQLLLVVMPNGYGIRGLPPADTAAVQTLPRPSSISSDALAQAATLAIPKLAAAAGHPLGKLTIKSSAAPASSSTLPTLVGLIVVAVAAAGGVILFRRRAALSRR